MKKCVDVNSQQQDRQALWDELAARKVAALLVDTGLTPNIITTLGLFMVVLSGLLFSTGNPTHFNVAALLFMLVRFFDHLDGELARLQHKESLVGYYYDWFTDTFSYSVLFISLSIGFQESLNNLLISMVILSVSACLINTALKLHGELIEDPELSKEFPAIGGFSIDDGVYLIGPLCWSGHLFTFFITCVTGAIIYLVFILGRFCLISTGRSGMDYNKTIDH